MRKLTTFTLISVLAGALGCASYDPPSPVCTKTKYAQGVIADIRTYHSDTYEVRLDNGFVARKSRAGCDTSLDDAVACFASVRRSMARELSSLASMQATKTPIEIQYYVNEEDHPVGANTITAFGARDNPRSQVKREKEMLYHRCNCDHPGRTIFSPPI
jgi:hypothetical protein